MKKNKGELIVEEDITSWKKGTGKRKIKKKRIKQKKKKNIKEHVEEEKAKKHYRNLISRDL